MNDLLPALSDLDQLNGIKRFFLDLDRRGKEMTTIICYTIKKIHLKNDSKKVMSNETYLLYQQTMGY